VVAPDLNVLPRNLADHLLEYVRKGGFLVLGPRSGMKDDANALLPQRQPGYLADALGGRVEQYYALERDFSATGLWGTGQISVWAEQLKTVAPDADVLLKYGAANGWLDGQPAAITHSYGKGRITYIGAVLDEKLMSAAADWMMKQSGAVPATISVPDGVDVSRRNGNRGQVYVLVNFNRSTQHVALPHAMQALLERKQEGEIDLPPYGVEILTDAK
jgi:beta-galactosidase